MTQVSQEVTGIALSTTQIRELDTSTLVRELRQLLKLTQEQFAAQVGGTVVTVNRWENQRSKPSAMALRHIEALLNELTTSPIEIHRVGARSLLTQYFSHCSCSDSNN